MKYHFEIHHASPQMQQVSRFMDNLDLGAKEYCVSERIEFTTKKEKEIAYIKDLIKQAYESIGHKVYKIEGVKIE